MPPLTIIFPISRRVSPAAAPSCSSAVVSLSVRWEEGGREGPRAAHSSAESWRPLSAAMAAREAGDRGSLHWCQCSQEKDMSPRCVQAGRHRPWSMGTSSRRLALRRVFTSTSSGEDPGAEAEAGVELLLLLLLGRRTPQGENRAEGAMEAEEGVLERDECW